MYIYTYVIINLGFWVSWFGSKGFFIPFPLTSKQNPEYMSRINQAIDWFNLFPFFSFLGKKQTFCIFHSFFFPSRSRTFFNYLSYFPLLMKGLAEKTECSDVLGFI